MEIYLAEIPKVNGREQFGFGPVLLVSQSIREISLIIPSTSNVLALRFPYTLKIEPSLKNGLSLPSILLIFQLRAIDSKRLKKKLGELEKFYAVQIKKQLRNIKDLINHCYWKQ